VNATQRRAILEIEKLRRKIARENKIIEDYNKRKGTIPISDGISQTDQS
jgi:hypothetical protein